MKHSPLLAGSALALILGLSGCGLASTGAAEGEVDRFHKHWNANEFKAIYDQAHESFHSKTADEVVAAFEGVRSNYGAFKSAKQKSWSINTNNGVTFVQLDYDSTYERDSAVERFIYRVVSGKPMLTDYSIVTPETAKKREAEEKAKQ